MSYMQWQDSYAVNIQEIDLHHKKLFVIINDLFDALRDSRGNEVVGKILKDFANYAMEHFAVEEKYMKVHDYPDYANHKKLHDDAVEKINDLIKLHDNGKVHLSIVTFNFLKDWLSNHVLSVDKKYVPFLKAKGL